MFGQYRRFAVVVPSRNSDSGEFSMSIIDMYDTKDELRKGYENWHKLAAEKGLVLPKRIEILDETGRCKILDS